MLTSRCKCLSVVLHFYVLNIPNLPVCYMYIITELSTFHIEWIIPSLFTSEMHPLQHLNLLWTHYFHYQMKCFPTCFTCQKVPLTNSSCLSLYFFNESITVCKSYINPCVTVLERSSILSHSTHPDGTTCTWLGAERKLCQYWDQNVSTHHISKAVFSLCLFTRLFVMWPLVLQL